MEHLRRRIEPRLPIEADFARLGHSYRHGPLHRWVEFKLTRPGLTVGLSALGLFGRGKRNALSPVVKNLTLSFKDLPPAFDGFRLMQLSDFHIDKVDGLAEVLEKTLPEVECDLCVFTGDYRFEDRGPCDEVYPRMRKVVESIRSKHGIFGILGNHDPGEMALGLQQLGVHMLVNDAAAITEGADTIWIVGLDDNFDYGRHDMPLALADVPPGAFKILLAHAPELFELAHQHGFQLNLSGHTHGGQLRLPVIGAVKLNANCPKPFTWGHWNYRELQGYTTCGIGCSSLPIRYNCPPEIVMLELRRVS